jgi:hypothetical membrane protein
MENFSISNKFIFVAIIIFTLCAIVAQIIAPIEYDWQNNTISQLAAQNYSSGWIMQLGFFGFGILFLIGIVLIIKQGSKVQITDILLLFYGLAILLSGIFSAKPFIEEIPYSLLESGLHYAFALSAGMFLNFTIFFHLIFSERTKERLFHLVFLMTIFISSMIIVLIKESELNAPLGLMQRITYLAGLIWLFIFFLKRDKIEIDNKLK